MTRARGSRVFPCTPRAHRFTPPLRLPPPVIATASETSPAAVEEPLPLRDPTADRYGRVDAVRDSPSDVATCHCLARRRTRSPVTRHRPAIDASGTSASRVWDPSRPASPENRTQSDPQDPSQARGVRWGRTVETVVERDSSRFVTIHRATSRFGRFGWPFRHPGRTPHQRNDLGWCYMTQTRPRSRIRCVGSSTGAR